MDLLWLLEGVRSPFLNTVFGWITRFGEETILIGIFCLMFWCINKRMAYVTGVAFFLSSLAVQGLKIVFRVPRPWVNDPSFSPVGGAVSASTGYSFPSGHTQNAAAILGALGIQVKQKSLKMILLTLPLLVALSRMYLGVHYLTDVAVSLLLTFLIILFARKVVTGDSVEPKSALLLSSFIIFCAMVVVVLATYLYRNEIVTVSHLRDSTRAVGAAIGFAVGMYVECVYIGFSPKTKNLLTQIIKFILGVLGTVAVQQGGRLTGTGLVIDAVGYFLVVVWITILYPMIIKRFFER